MSSLTIFIYLCLNERCQFTTKAAVNCQLSNVNYQLSTVNCQLSTVHCHLSTVNCQLTTVNCQLSTVSCQLSTDHWPLSTVKCPLSTVKCQLSISEHVRARRSCHGGPDCPAARVYGQLEHEACAGQRLYDNIIIIIIIILALYIIHFSFHLKFVNVSSQVISCCSN